MTVTTTNLLMGPAKLSTGVFGVAEPASGATALGVGWTDAGGTSGGCTMSVAQTYTPLGPIDQLAMDAGAQRTNVMITISTNLAEATLANFRLAVNAATNAATFHEIDGDQANGQPGYTAVCLEGQKPGGGVRRVFARKCLQVGDVGVPFQESGLTLFPVKFQLYYVTSAIKPYRLDDTP